VIPLHDQDDLVWHFSDEGFEGGRGVASPLGAQLALASTRYKTSDQRIVDTRRIVLATRQLAARAPDGEHLVAQVWTPWAYAFVPKEKPQASPPSYPDLPGEPDEDETSAEAEERVERAERRAARKARIVARLGRCPHEVWETLRAMFGPVGQHWASRPRGRRWALLPLTRTGGEELGSGEAGPWLVDLAHRTPLPPWAEAALDQAEEMEAHAAAAWAAARPPRAHDEAENTLADEAAPLL
jgi:hypothetical protein